MDYTTCIQRTLDHIEDHLKEPLTAEELAALAGFSLYHFYKVFQSRTGLPVMDYIRRRRLAYAAADLTSGRTLLDIALDYGFETHAGFTKAFRKTYGLTPEQYRIHATGRVPERVDLAKLSNYNMTGGMMMRPTIVIRPEFKLVGYALETRMHGENFTEIPAFWNRYIEEQWGRKLYEQVKPLHNAEYGACIMLPDKPDHFLYVIGFEVETFDNVPEGVHQAIIPASTYAVFTSPKADRAEGAFSSAIQGMTTYVYNEWFPSSGYAYSTGGVDFELYDERSSGDRDLQMDLYVPIEKKAE
ncbi:AraC family transcriptional regulator [Saccharibacillus kuerlensis]|uniref:AraC family transcriptional regulator n=1 Tax=Saccharibacillus kuerlensis TaxID=459527 RepID=A0ABQ2L8I3_9BACL|nr:AraC family transcriptional regulator [Saccharibacillus kuerlensis]GGO06812.1 AraC family transcriptional regulator [Saccharibacillus kuerlensis]